MAGQDPLLVAQVRVQYCEWLLTCRGSILPSNGDNLEHLSQALVSLSTYRPPATPQPPTLTAQPAKHSSQSSRSPRSASARAGTPGRKVSATSVAAHAEAIIEGVQGARRLDEAVRVCVLWSIIAKDPPTRLQWLLHGATCATKMASASFDAILAMDAAADCKSAQQSSGKSEGGAHPSLVADTGADDAGESAHKYEKVAFVAPESLQDWLLFSMSTAQLDKVLKEAARCKESAGDTADNPTERKGVQTMKRQPTRTALTAPDGAGGWAASQNSFTDETLHCVHRTFAWLNKLREELQQHTCAAHCLPLMWLQVLLCAWTSGRDGACVMLSELSNCLQRLGLSHQAQSCQLLVGMYLLC